MNRILLVLPALALVAACDTLTDRQMAGTLGGAAVGAVVTPNNPVQGALIGSAVGLAASTYLGKTAAGECVYQRDDGTRFIAACPS